MKELHNNNSTISKNHLLSNESQTKACVFYWGITYMYVKMFVLPETFLGMNNSVRKKLLCVTKCLQLSISYVDYILFIMSKNKFFCKIKF